MPPKTSSVVPYIAKPFNYLGNTRVFKWLAKNYEKDSAKFIAGVSLSSVVLKDTFGCYFYVTQSLKNKDIPEDKRKFVAALDLTNGVLMIAAQIATFFTVSNAKVQNFLFDKTLGKYFTNAARRNSKELLKAQGKEIPKKQFYDAFKNAEKTSRAAFKIFLPLVAATILAKRVLVPLVATPLASWAKTNVLKGDEGEHKCPENVCNSNILDHTSLRAVYKNIENACD